MKRIFQSTVAALIVLSASLSVCAKDTQVKGYTKKDGTKVAGYTRHTTDPDKQKVGGYTRKDGTVVKGYERKKTSKSTSK